MNDQKILALIAVTPDIRAVQISDKFDRPLCDVSASLRSLVEVGDLVKHSGTAPNGQPTQMYNLSDAFKASKDGKALLATAPGQKAPTISAPAPFTPVFSEQTELRKRGLSRVDRAIEHLRENREASNAELRTAMGLQPGSPVASYLPKAINNGRIRRNANGYWELGDGKPVPPRAPAPSVNAPLDNVVTAGNLVLATRDAQPVPREVLQAVQQLDKSAEAGIPASPRPDVGNPISPTLRCAIWSDGMVELQRDGRLQAQLTRAEADFIADFILGQRQAVTA